MKLYRTEIVNLFLVDAASYVVSFFVAGEEIVFSCGSIVFRVDNFRLSPVVYARPMGKIGKVGGVKESNVIPALAMDALFHYSNYVCFRKFFVAR